uniref:Uncharacterized protein n=1 Tax=Hyaloperonospora arabidopsidis (strain Emoy2) TaxID=559515 RepID=M4BQL4_HYAAE
MCLSHSSLASSTVSCINVATTRSVVLDLVVLIVRKVAMPWFQYVPRLVGFSSSILSSEWNPECTWKPLLTCWAPIPPPCPFTIANNS